MSRIMTRSIRIIRKYAELRHESYKSRPEFKDSRIAPAEILAYRKIALILEDHARIPYDLQGTQAEEWRTFLFELDAPSEIIEPAQRAMMTQRITNQRREIKRLIAYQAKSDARFREERLRNQHDLTRTRNFNHTLLLEIRDRDSGRLLLNIATSDLDAIDKMLFNSGLVQPRGVLGVQAILRELEKVKQELKNAQQKPAEKTLRQIFTFKRSQ